MDSKLLLLVGVAFALCACPSGSSSDHGAAGKGGDAPSGDAGRPKGAHGEFDAGKDPNRNHVKAGQICKRFAQIQCAGEAFCCDDPGRDRAACEAAQDDLCTMQIHLDAMSQNKIAGFDAGLAATALNHFEQLAAQCDASISAFAEAADGLLSMMKGTVAAGDSCSPGVTLDAEAVAASLVSCKNVAKTACLPQDALRDQGFVRTPRRPLPR